MPAQTAKRGPGRPRKNAPETNTPTARVKQYQGEVHQFSVSGKIPGRHYVWVESPKVDLYKFRGYEIELSHPNGAKPLVGTTPRDQPHMRHDHILMSCSEAQYLENTRQGEDQAAFYEELLSGEVDRGDADDPLNHVDQKSVRMTRTIESYGEM